MAGYSEDDVRRLARLDQAFAEFIEEVQSGKSPERQKLLSRYPDVADKLTELMDAYDPMRRILRPSPPPLQDPFPLHHRLGRIDLNSIVGRGAFGTVYKGYDTTMLRWVAVKAIRTDPLAPAENQKRAFREAEVAAQLSHPNIVRMHDVGRCDGVTYFVSEFVTGQTLAQLIQEKRLSTDEVVELIATIADALHHAHLHKVIHRDMKPSNIMMRHGRTPLVMDFGLALWDTGDASISSDGRIIGTLSYMSPEQARGQARVDGRSDVYSLGVMLYEMLTDELPFVGSVQGVYHQIQHDEPRPLRTLDSALHRDLETICMRCLQKEPNRRYATAAELAEDLRRFLARKPVIARPIGPVERATRWAQRNPAVATTGTLAILLLVATTLVSASWAIHAGRQADEIKKGFVERSLLVAESQVDRGLAAAERGDIGQAMHWLARSLTTVPKAGTEIESTARMNLQSWPRQNFPLIHCVNAPKLMYNLGIDPDGKRLWIAPGDDFNAVQRWDIATSQFVGPSIKHPDRLTALAISGDGTRIATSSAKQPLRLWDANTGTPISIPKLELARKAYWMGFLPDGRLLVATIRPKRSAKDNTQATEDNTQATEFQVWDLETGQPSRKSFVHVGIGSAIALNESGTTVSVANMLQKTIDTYDLDTGRMGMDRIQHTAPVQAIAISPDGQYLAITGIDRTTHIWHRKRQRVEAVLRHLAPATSVRFARDGGTVVTVSPDDAIRVWSTPKAREIDITTLSPDALIETLALNPDGDLLASGSFDNFLRLWRTKPGALTLQGQFPLSLKMPRSVAFSPDGKFVGVIAQTNVSFSKNCEVQIWDVSTGTEQHGLQDQQAVYGWAFSPDSKKVVAGRDNAAMIWDISMTGAKNLITLPHPNIVFRVAFSPDGRTIATGCKDGKARIWDITSGTLLHESFSHIGMVTAVKFSPDGQKLLSVGDRTAHFWEPQTGKGEAFPLEHGGEISIAALSPNGKTVLTGGKNNIGRLWDTEGRFVRGSSLQHAGEFTAVAFAPSGSWVVTTSEDHTGKIWNAENGRLLGPPLYHTFNVRSVVIDPNGRWIYTAGRDQTIRRWPAPTPIAGTPAQLAAWVAVETGTVLDSAGVIRVLTPSGWQEARTVLASYGGPPAN